jgi:hypothetical protein
MRSRLEAYLAVHIYYIIYISIKIIKYFYIIGAFNPIRAEGGGGGIIDPRPYKLKIIEFFYLKKLDFLIMRTWILLFDENL